MSNNQLFIEAKFSSKCAETGQTIKKGDWIYYDRATKKPYCKDSDRYKDIKEMQDTARFVQANDDAYFDNFCQQNNI